MPITIRDVRVILTAPAGINLVVVKVETSEPGLYGLGCATFTQRYQAVRAAIEEHLRPLVLGREVDRIEDLFQLMTLHGYWRNGPVVNNAVSGIDMALWDIKGKRAGMPVYELLGGKCREAAAVYRHASGETIEQVKETVAYWVNEGVRHVRVQCGFYGGSPLVLRPETAGYGGAAAAQHKPDGALDGSYYDPRNYTRCALAAIEAVRNEYGDSLELIHDVHERLKPAQAVEFAKELEKYRLFFLEDLLAPEDIAWFANVRAVCSTPLAMGELFVHPAEWTPLMVNRQIDFVRMHMSATGGLTPARKIAAMAEIQGIRTAWHGPGDVSPIGHAANLHLNLATPNFGIQEFPGFSDELREVFPGCPELRRGYLYPHAGAGWGLGLDEREAEKFPCKAVVDVWTQARLPDGSLGRP